MRTNAVIVTDDDPGRALGTVKWLRESGIPAYTSASDFPGKRIEQAISELKPGIVLCGSESTGNALFDLLRVMPAPPMMILLRESKPAHEGVRHVAGVIVVSIRRPVPLPALCAFIRTALAAMARLSDAERPLPALPGDVARAGYPGEGQITAR